MLNTGYIDNMTMKATVTVFLFLSLVGLNTSLYEKHYYSFYYSLSWSDAQKHCRKSQDELSTMSYREMQKLSANMWIDDYYWIGLHRDANDPNLWRWSGGEEATVSWAPNQPSNQNEECGAVKKSSSNVHDYDCSDQLPFFCMRYELIVVQQESTWEEALQYCRQNYINLAILSSEDFMIEAKNKSTKALTDDVWIGLRFLAGHWFWLNGDDLGYKVWSAGGEPQCPAMDQRCGVYDRTLNAWKPSDCERKLKFLCVKKPWKQIAVS